jgi:hypothetical protein
VAASIREFGFRQPIVVDPAGVIVVGHTRYKAAHKLGLEKVPVHVAKDRWASPLRERGDRLPHRGQPHSLTGDLELRAAADRPSGEPWVPAHSSNYDLVNTAPPSNLKVEPRSYAIAAGLSSFTGTTHHQKLDVESYPQKGKTTGKKLRAKDRPVANDFVSDKAFDALLDARFGDLA